MSRLTSARRALRRAVRRVTSRISSDDLASTLDRLMGDRTESLIVHSSLSSCGYFPAGPGAVVQAFRDRCETLVLPTHTYSYPEPPGSVAPLFDPARTPSRNGMLTEVFRARPDARRSIQSTHSLAVAGAAAEALTGKHYESSTPCGRGTPYDRLLQRGTSALMFGVTFHSYTFFHTAEDAADSPFAYEPETVDQLRVITETGSERVCPTRRQTRNPRRFAEAGDLLERLGLVRSVRLGQGTLLFAPDCVRVHDFLVERLRRTRDFLYQTCKAPLQ